MNSGLKAVWWTFRHVIAGFVRHEGMIMAGYLAFMGLLAIFPFFIFLTALAGEVGQSDQGLQAIDQLLETLPPDVAGVLAGPIKEVVDGASRSVLTFGAVVAIWTAANGMEGARTAVRRAYMRKSKRPAWSRRLESIGLIALVAILLLIGMAVQVLGPAIWQSVNAHVEIPSVFDTLWRWMRFGLSPLALFLALYGLYFALTPRGVQPRYRAPGALLSLAIWMLMAAGLSTYLRYFNNYDVTYGSLAGIMITIIFLFLLSLGFIMGAELNATLMRRHRLARRLASTENKE